MLFFGVLFFTKNRQKTADNKAKTAIMIQKFRVRNFIFSLFPKRTLIITDYFNPEKHINIALFIICDKNALKKI